VVCRITGEGWSQWLDRVLRLLREHQLLSPSRQPEPSPTNPHEGTIAAPDPMWGADATATFTVAEGNVTVFAVIDPCTAECLGIHAVKKATRFEALEPIRPAVKEHFGDFSAATPTAQKLRHDHGSVYMSDDFQSEIQFLGIESSPAFVRQPEGNGCIERFFRTLKEQLFWLRRFHDLEELRTALMEFRDRYNHHWILERLKYRTPLRPAATFNLNWSPRRDSMGPTYTLCVVHRSGAEHR
jgi:transposase InsO family protein